MAFLKQIVEEINAQLVTEIFSGHNYQGAKYYALAELVRRESQEEKIFIPVIVDDNNQECELDEASPLVIYHRQVTSSFNLDPNKKSYGNDRNISESATMMMVVMGDRKRLQTTPDTLASSIASNMINGITTASMSALNLTACEIKPVQAYMDKEVVWQSEYRQAGCPLDEELIYFAIQYQIDTSYSKRCFTICSEC